MGRVWKLVVFDEVSSRAGSPLFGWKRSPQQVEFGTPQATVLSVYEDLS